MRNRTRRYTTSLPFIGQDALTHLKDAPVNLHIPSIPATFTRSDDGFIVTLNGNTFPLFIIATQASYGTRYWYQCPKCAKRATKLYMDSDMLTCRTCSGLCYASQSESQLKRWQRLVHMENMAKLELWPDYWDQIARVGFTMSRLPKPTGMRWDTFRKKYLELLRLRVKCREAHQRLANGKR
ncbi:hypothetical protein [Pectobacterium versatile]|uniref:hypothetical protein n=1 Tax=Pectobacterium versatile TaxID=2488639 RepID=UPI00102EAE41|nr:hypothetical protein [Pectobacterium versatile]TAI99400.1 hypothetical protein EG332_04815 [Pectobacterium versatile]UEQ07833.1 hypothetical protein LLE50_13230 [Pectobacterium versatile]